MFEEMKKNMKKIDVEKAEVGTVVGKFALDDLKRFMEIIHVETSIESILASLIKQKAEAISIKQDLWEDNLGDIDYEDKKKLRKRGFTLCLDTDTGDISIAEK
jgi:hypothetical protein